MPAIHVVDFDPVRVAREVYDDVFRRDWGGCGFALIQFESVTSSTVFRQRMVELQKVLDQQLQVARGMRLRFQSLARFDQQTTTKFHRDGGPDESILMLGYEPTPVQSSVTLADYTRAAHDLGLTPREFMEQHNPMFGPGEQLLASYLRPLTEFDSTRYQIVLINNSCLPWTPQPEHSLGVLHQATILTPDPSQSRIINSTMLVIAPPEAPEPISPDQLTDFVESDAVARRSDASGGYESPP